jgi:hypothetical protein
MTEVTGVLAKLIKYSPGLLVGFVKIMANLEFDCSNRLRNLFLAIASAFQWFFL